jgi:hypothetical protein
MYALTAFALTHLAGWAHPFWWQLTLDTLLAIGIGFAALTAREISGRWYATQIAVLLYPLAFASILNVFFWFSDMTFGLEMAFTAAAWYFGLRGLREARLGFWLLAMALGALAVLSKEPAFVLVHVVLVGSLAISYGTHRSHKTHESKEKFWVGAIAYALLLALSLFMVLASPTRGNRFLALASPGIWVAIRERMAYYGGVYFGIAPRMLIFFPLVYAALKSKLSNGRMLRVLILSMISMAAAMLLFSNLIVGLVILTAILIALSVMPNAERERARRFLPFLACIVIAALALLVTVQQVKTQLTEIAIMSAMIASWAWCVWLKDLRSALRHMTSKTKRTLFEMSFEGILIVAVLAAMPRLTGEEKMLRAVRDVRWNANDALTWTAIHLPKDALFATTLYSLHGIEHQNLLTAKSDSTKLFAQYTFDGGFVYHVLEVLGRRDIRHAYLADSGQLVRLLPAMRESPSSYLFLQSGLDLALFHGSPPLLRSSDTCVARFARGPYPCEVWLMRN